MAKKKGKSVDHLKELEQLLIKDVNSSEGDRRRELFPRIEFLRLMIRFLVYLIIITLLYFVKVIDSFRIWIAALSFFILLETIRLALKKPKE